MLTRKRIVKVSIGFILLLMVILARLVQIQLIQTENFTEENINLIQQSVKQRTQELVIDQGRGRFVDRNNEPLTHKILPTLVLFPFLKSMNWPIEEVATILHVPEDEIISELKKQKKPFVFGGKQPYKLTEKQMNEINELKIPGVFAVHRKYQLNDNIAEHLIGMIGENPQLIEKKYPNKNLAPQTLTGISGLEKVFDEFLLPEGQSKLMYHVDGIGGPLFGVDVKYTAPANPYYPVEIKTTIDKEIQLGAERIIDKYELKKGGLVLLDIESNDIVAMVSRPIINRDNPYRNQSVENQMVYSQIPGSVFKTVIAAAAIEKNLDKNNRFFNCNLNLYGEPSKNHDYGELTFEESFAKSCNYTFAALTKELIELDPNVVETYAERLALLAPVGWNGDVFHFEDFSQFDHESHGNIWGDENDKKVDRAISQTGIGQKNVRVTPLAIANMMATIARGGEKKQVRTVSEVLYKNGSTLFSFPSQKIAGETIAPYTAMKLQTLLRDVVKSGTGQRFESLPYKVAGKSGTAELGRKTKDGRELVNKWFTGYFPADQPKYALVVVDLEQVNSQAVTYDVFYDMVNEVYKNQQSVEGSLSANRG